MATEEGLPAVKHVTQREFCGMLEYKKDDEVVLVRNLVIGKD